MVYQASKPSLGNIQTQLADVDYKVRKEGIAQLMLHYHQQALSPLLPLLQDERPDVRAKAVEALGKLGDTLALGPMLGLLSDRSSRVRAKVAGALGNFGDQSVVPTLTALLSDRDSAIRQSAARSLGRLRAPASLPALLKYLQEAREHYEVYEAIQALGDYGTPAVIDPLLAVVEGKQTRWTPWASGVSRVLSKLGANEAPVLMSILEDLTRSEQVRICILEACAGRKTFLRSYAALLKDSSPLIRQKAVQALGQSKSPRALEPLIQALADTHMTVVEEAIRALGQSKSPRALEPLIRMLADTHTSVVVEAIHALVALEAISTVKQLLPLLSSQNTYIVRATVDALEQFRDTIDDGMIDSNSLDFPSFLPDVEAGTTTALRHLLDLGHRRIAHLGAHPDSEIFRVCQDSYARVLNEAGLLVSPAYQIAAFVDSTENDALVVAKSCEAAVKLLSSAEPPSAFLCDDKLMAKGVYRAANLLDMRVPDHLSVVGFAADDAPWLHPPLTSVSIPGLEISSRAMELILTCLEGEIASFLEIIPMTFVVRASTAAPSAESGRD